MCIQWLELLLMQPPNGNNNTILHPRQRNWNRRGPWDLNPPLQRHGQARPKRTTQLPRFRWSNRGGWGGGEDQEGHNKLRWPASRQRKHLTFSPQDLARWPLPRQLIQESLPTRKVETVLFFSGSRPKERCFTFLLLWTAVHSPPSAIPPLSHSTYLRYLLEHWDNNLPAHTALQLPTISTRSLTQDHLHPWFITWLKRHVTLQVWCI